MKKIYALIAVAATVLTLSACGSTADTGSSTTADTASNVVADTPTYNDPAYLASELVSDFNAKPTSDRGTNDASSADCMKTGDGVFNCAIKFDDGKTIIQAFTVSPDGQQYMSKNS